MAQEGLNKVMLIGFVGSRNLELKHTAGGQAVCKFSLATNETIKGDTHTEWHDIVVWNKQAENLCKYSGTGKLLYVEGKIRKNEWEDKTTGEKRSKTEVIASRITYLPGGSKNTNTNEPTAVSADNGGGGDDMPF